MLGIKPGSDKPKYNIKGDMISLLILTQFRFDNVNYEPYLYLSTVRI